MEDLSRAEFLVEDGHTYTKESAWDDLAEIHNIYRGMLDAYVRLCIANRKIPSEHEIAVAMEGIGESLANEADRALEFLPNESYTPHDSAKLIAKAHTSIIDGLRVQPISWAGVFESIFRPEPTRGMAPQNPATLAAKGEL